MSVARFPVVYRLEQSQRHLELHQKTFVVPVVEGDGNNRIKGQTESSDGVRQTDVATARLSCKACRILPGIWIILLVFWLNLLNCFA